MPVLSTSFIYQQCLPRHSETLTQFGEMSVDENIVSDFNMSINKQCRRNRGRSNSDENMNGDQKPTHKANSGPNLDLVTEPNYNSVLIVDRKIALFDFSQKCIGTVPNVHFLKNGILRFYLH